MCIELGKINDTLVGNDQEVAVSNDEMMRMWCSSISRKDRIMALVNDKFSRAHGLQGRMHWKQIALILWVVSDNSYFYFSALTNESNMKIYWLAISTLLLLSAFVFGLICTLSDPTDKLVYFQRKH